MASAVVDAALSSASAAARSCMVAQLALALATITVDAAAEYLASRRSASKCAMRPASPCSTCARCCRVSHAVRSCAWFASLALAAVAFAYLRLLRLLNCKILRKKD